MSEPSASAAPVDRRPSPSDEDRVAHARLLAGDGAALADAYDRFGNGVYCLAERVTRNPALAEEVTQEVFCQLWRQPDRFDPRRGSMRSFLMTLAHRRAVDMIRRSEAARQRDVVYFRERPSIAADVEAEVGTSLTAEAVRAVIDELPEEQRRPIVLAYYEGYTFRQLAHHLGIPEGTAKSRIRLGLAKLGSALTAKGPIT